MMKRAGKLLTVLVVGALGIWGCAKGPANPNAQADKAHALESKCAELEKDYRAVASARDDARKKITSLEEESKRFQKQLDSQKTQLLKEQEVNQQIVKERDDLRLQMESRTSERDLLKTRCDRLKTGLQNLLGQDEALLAPPSQSIPSAPVLGN